MSPFISCLNKKRTTCFAALLPFLASCFIGCGGYKHERSESELRNDVLDSGRGRHVPDRPPLAPPEPPRRPQRKKGALSRQQKIALYIEYYNIMNEPAPAVELPPPPPFPKFAGHTTPQSSEGILIRSQYDRVQNAQFNNPHRDSKMHQLALQAVVCADKVASLDLPFAQRLIEISELINGFISDARLPSTRLKHESVEELLKDPNINSKLVAEDAARRIFLSMFADVLRGLPSLAESRAQIATDLMLFAIDGERAKPLLQYPTEEFEETSGTTIELNEESQFFLRKLNEESLERPAKYLEVKSKGFSSLNPVKLIPSSRKIRMAKTLQDGLHGQLRVTRVNNVISAIALTRGFHSEEGRAYYSFYQLNPTRFAELPNGVRLAQYPKELMTGAAYATTELAAANGRGIEGGKAIFPANWSTSDILEAAAKVVRNPDLVDTNRKHGAVYKGVVSGVALEVVAREDIHGDLIVHSIYPTWRQWEAVKW